MILSVAILALNEENYLPKLLDDLMHQSYPLENVELLLIDSMSNDDTYQIMEDFKEKNIKNFSDINILTNIKKNQSTGWNIAIKAFKGDSLTRVDGHSSLDKDFLKNISIELEKGEDVVGGPRGSVIDSTSRLANVLYISENSMFGSGIASYRKKSNTDSYKKTMFHATYKKEVVEKVGFFNENLGRTEDNDYHYRIRKEGFKLFFSNRIQSSQFVRPTLKRMIIQKYGNGFWVGRTLFVQPYCLSIFHFVPFFFVCSLLISVVLMLLGITGFLFEFTLISYTIFCLLTTVINLVREKKYMIILLPFFLLSLHLSYGIGTSIGLMKGCVENKKISKKAKEGIN